MFAHKKNQVERVNYIRYKIIGTLLQYNIAAFNKTKNSHKVLALEILCTGNAKCLFL